MCGLGIQTGHYKNGLFVFYDISTMFGTLRIWKDSKADLALKVTFMIFAIGISLSRFKGENGNPISLKSCYKKSPWDRKYWYSHL